MVAVAAVAPVAAIAAAAAVAAVAAVAGRFVVVEEDSGSAFDWPFFRKLQTFKAKCSDKNNCSEKNNNLLYNSEKN